MNLQIKCMKLNRKIEKISAVYHFLLAKLTYFIFIMPDLCMTTINYYILNLNDESFHLATPMMWVKSKKVYIEKRWAPITWFLSIKKAAIQLENTDRFFVCLDFISIGWICDSFLYNPTSMFECWMRITGDLFL